MTKFPVQIIPPNPRIQLVDAKTGILTYSGLQFLQQLWSTIVNTNQITPCTCTHGSSNDYTLTPFPTPPAFQTPNYADFQVYTFVANGTSGGLVTARVAGLAFLPVYKNNGASQATTGDVTNGLLYQLIYNSTFNSGNGGFSLK